MSVFIAKHAVATSYSWRKHR